MFRMIDSAIILNATAVILRPHALTVPGGQ